MLELLREREGVGRFGWGRGHVKASRLRMPGYWEPPPLIEGAEGDEEGVAIALIELFTASGEPASAQVSTDSGQSSEIDWLHK